MPDAAPHEIPRRPAGIAPLSSAQQRFWLFERFWPGTAVYNRPVALRMRGALDVAALRDALGDVIDRHEALRTAFHDVEGTPIQSIAEPGLPALPVRDLTNIPAPLRDEEMQRAVVNEVARPFDLSRSSIRHLLLRLDDRDHILVVTVHHIVFDGWSAGVLLRELSACYDARAGGQEPALPALLIQCADHAVWQAGRLSGERLNAHLEYWRTRLAGAPDVLELPTDRPRPARRSFRGDRRSLDISSGNAESLERFAMRERVTSFMVMLSAFAVLLQRYSGEDDLVVGCPIAGRTRVELEGLIGCFINTLPIRIDTGGDPSFRDLLARVRREALGAFAHQDLPLQSVVKMMRPDRSATQPPLFQTMFNFRNLPARDVRMRGLEVEELNVEIGTSLVDLSLEIAGIPGGLQVAFEFDVDLFDADSLERSLDRYVTLLNAAVAGPDLPLSALPLVSETERRHVIALSDGGAAQLPEGRCIHHLVAERAARTPDAVAIEASGERVTYAQLIERSGRVARALRALGVGPDLLVGVCIERSADLMVVLLGVLRAGGAYLPLDPEYPDERLAFMLRDAAPRVVVTRRSKADWLRGSVADVIVIDDLAPDETPFERDGGAAPENLAYVMYTSGSTGKPKGVMVPHRGVLNHNLAVVEAFGLRPGDRVMQFASVSFDGSVEEIFPTWIAGATLVIRSDAAHASARAFLDEIARERIAVLNLPTAYWHEWVAALPVDARLPASLRLVVVGGEQASAKTYRHWRARAGPGVRWLNTYGPTEGTIVATIWDPETSPIAEDGAVLPIGRPLPNVRTYVLDGGGRPQPADVPGELWIGGAGVARGYLNRPELTAARFTAEPFAPSAGMTMYRTGDRARWRANGVLEFMGRLDGQAKVRGYRVEPGEIESVLRSLPGIRDAEVVLRENALGGGRLVAYIASPDDAASDSRTIRATLAGLLPAHMVPDAIVTLGELPRDESGSVDHRALPEAPVAQDPDSGPAAPRNETERRLMTIWRELLGSASFGIHDDFFAVGGHSLLALRLTARVETEFGARLPPTTLFEAGTVARLAARLERPRSAARSTPLVPIQPIGDRPPFFCVHEFFGDVMVYGHLARHLGPEQPFFGLQAPGLEGDEIPVRDVPELAALYVDAIRTVQPAGPYALGGLCAGGVIAFEMAQQLAANGETVRLLALLDANAYSLGTPSSVASGAGGEGRNEPARSVTEWMTGAAELTAAQWRALIRLKSQLVKARLTSLTRSRGNGSTAYRMHAFVAAHDLSPQHRSVGESLRDGLRAYRPGPYEGRVVLFRPRMQPLFGSRDPTRGWGPLVGDRLTVRVVPGNHLAMLQEPHVRVVARELSACLAAEATTTPLPRMTPPTGRHF